jgi:hypothetical protein
VREEEASVEIAVSCQVKDGVIQVKGGVSQASCRQPDLSEGVSLWSPAAGVSPSLGRLATGLRVGLELPVHLVVRAAR